ncbi:hypothetical protein M407DRAFT_136019 [Tulasnella calospora MUT 4182]|uniref:Uncharacterized protein n=1 Tax=Tulasnella calospora MUT 4182 TaxID=1051891 RepID=A0A0C3QRJ3_9AGAM|nr:hypothetical protein M407DRAFT_136019 [Tulasnella calospora MUT 4182]
MLALPRSDMRPTMLLAVKEGAQARYDAARTGGVQTYEDAKATAQQKVEDAKNAAEQTKEKAESTASSWWSWGSKKANEKKKFGQ